MLYNEEQCAEFCCTATRINIVSSEEVTLSEKSQLLTSTLASFKLILVTKKMGGEKKNYNTPAANEK